MNPRLKLALILHRGEQGFASVIAVGVGLVLMIIGLTMALRSQSDVALSSTQKNTSRALSAAEVGVTRYQQLINKNRQIVSYPDCISRSNLNANGNCSDSNSGTITDKKLVSWYNISNYKGFNTCSNTGTSGSDISSQSGTQWRDIDPPTVTPVYSGDISKGQYRLVSYSYEGNVDDPSKVPAGTVIGTGTLTVEGRVNVTGTGQSAKTTVSTSTAQLKVQIPVTKSIGSLPPGLWTTGTVIGGNQTVDGDIYLQCGATKPTNNITSGKTIQNTSQPVPSTPSLPTTEYLDLSATDINADLTLGSTTTSSGNGGDKVVTSYTVTPTTNTNPLGAGLYVYKINNITGGTITIPPDQKVRIFLTGSISKGVSIVHNCPSGSTTCKASDVVIYGTGTGQQMCLNGSNTISAFIMAPDYSIGVDGGGKANPVINGNVWAKNWGGTTCDSSSEKIVVKNDPSITWESLSSLGITVEGIPPTIDMLSSWQKQKVQ